MRFIIKHNHVFSQNSRLIISFTRNSFSGKGNAAVVKLHEARRNLNLPKSPSHYESKSGEVTWTVLVLCLASRRCTRIAARRLPKSRNLPLTQQIGDVVLLITEEIALTHAAIIPGARLTRQVTSVEEH